MFDKLSFIGAGSLAEAIISGIVAKQFLPADHIHVTNRQSEERRDHIQSTYHVQTSSDKAAVIKDADVIILAMKPKDVTEALQSIRSFIQPDQLVISVLAGVSTDYISYQLQTKAPVVRAMPNTSATIGFSATAIAGGQYATDAHIEQTKTLFQNIGTTTIVQEEDLHAVTGLSGSGPAYIYYFVEAMEGAAEEAGLKKETAKELIIQTLVGAAEMLKTTDDQQLN